MAKYPKGLGIGFLFILLLFQTCHGTTKSTEYSLSFLPNYLPDSPILCLYVTAAEERPVPFNISAPATGYSASRVVRYGEMVKFTFEDSNYALLNTHEKGKVITIRTESDGKLFVYGGNLHQDSSDTFLVLPKQEYMQQNSYKYIAVSYFSSLSQLNSSVAIIAQYNGTQLSIRSKVDITIDNTLTLTGAATIIALQEGEVFLVQSWHDLTGLQVVSNNPLTMMSGHECTNVPNSTAYCDHLVEQIPPVSSWGRKFATAPLKGRQAYDVFRILASENLTMVVVNCTLSADQPTLYNTTSTYMINEGNFVEFNVSSSQYCLIEGNDSVLVLQYSVGTLVDSLAGDPTMIIVPAVSQYCNRYSLPTFQPDDNSFTFSHYMNIFIPAQYYQPNQILFDNQQLSSSNLFFTAIMQDGAPQVYAAQVDLTEGVHTLRHADAEARVGVIMYGFGSYNAYGHPGGLCLTEGPLPTIIGFRASYQQVREEEGMALICLTRKRNLDRNDTVTVITLPQMIGEEVFPGTVGNASFNVTFDAGASEACFELDIIMDDEMENSNHFRLKIVSNTERIVLDKDLEITLIIVVDAETPCPQSFIFLETPVSSQAELPCSQLDGSFLPGGMVTARCTANNTWGPLDMSQCTFTNGISVAAVAVVEVQSLVEDSILEMNAITRSSYADNATSQYEYYNIYGERVQVYSIRLNQIVSAEELKRSLESATAVISRVIVIRREEFCRCCDDAAIELSASLFKTIESCTGSHEAPIACTCLNGSSQCQRRFNSTSGACFLDTDRDGKPDYMDPCVGCCLPDYNFGFQWKQAPHNYYDEAPCSKIHPSFSDTTVRRKCLPDDSWEQVDISSCTFKNTTRNPIYLLTTSLVVTQDVNKTAIIADIQQTVESQLPNFTREVSLNNTGYEITSLESSTTYANGTTVSTIVFVVEFESSVVLRENVTNLKEDETPTGVIYTFEEIVAVKPSGSCSCTVSSGHLANLCIGTSSSPCDCSDFGTCKCIDPYVDDDGECSLDTDGDSTPDYRDECPGTFGNDSRGCPLTIPSDQGFCPAEEDTVWRIQWPDAIPGSTQSVRCPGEGDMPGLGLAHRSCLTGGVWGSVDASNCESVAIRDVRIQTRNLNKDLSFARTFGLPVLPQQRNAVRNISANLRSALNLSVSRQENVKPPVLPQDLKTSTRLLSLIADLGENNDLFTDDKEKTEQQKEIVVDIVSSLLQEENEPSFAATTKGTDPNENTTASPAVQILESTEKVANAVTASSSKQNSSVDLFRSNIAIHGRPLSFNQIRNTQSSFQFPGPGVMLSIFSRPALVPKMNVPSAFVSAAKGKEDSMGMNATSDGDHEVTGLVTTVFNNIEKFLPDTLIDEPTQERMSEGIPVKPQTLPASLVLSSQIAGYSGGEVDSNATVDITFPIKEEIRNISVPSNSMKLFHCAFFNFTGGANGTGGWSYSGVQTEVINETHVRCNAAHLTSFVVLVSIIPAEDTPVDPLDYITYIGCSISFLCLLACIAFFISLRKELITKLHNFVHLNLCIALALGLFLFLTGIQTATGNIGACKFIAFLLHYFFLATFTWTLCEAVLIYNLLKAAFGANNRKWIYVYLIFGWVLPIPVVLISVASRHEYYLIRHSFDEDSPLYDQVKACWLPSEKGMIFAFVGPMIVILLINAVLLIISLAALAETRSGSSVDNEKDGKEQLKVVGKRLFKATIILVPVMGFTWIIGLFAVGEEGKVFAYLFVFANVFQGLFIFLFHVVRHEKVYGKIKSKLPNLKSLITERSGFWSAATSGIDSSKVTSAAADIGAVGDERAEDNKGGEDKGVLELIGRLVDEDDRGPNQYEEPRPGTVATTMFVAGSVKNEDELSDCAIEDDEKRANTYDVPRPANAYDVPRPTTVATYYNI